MTKKEKKPKGSANSIKEDLRAQVEDHKAVGIVYLVLRIMVVIVMIRSFVLSNYDNVFMCFLTLVLFMIPSFFERRIKINVPDVLEIIILLFIFSAEILGEISGYYQLFPYWDTVLHTLNGFIAAGVGFSLIDILNRSDKFAINMSPLFVAMVAFCFSMTVGVVWEFFEFGMDQIFLTDMQKDTVVPYVASVMLDPNGLKTITIPIDSVVVNGQQWNYGGYIDIGLIDTMEDLFVNFVGAAVFSIVGLIYIKNRGKKGRLAKSFILTRIRESDPDPKGRRKK